MWTRIALDIAQRILDGHEARIGLRHFRDGVKAIIEKADGAVFLRRRATDQRLADIERVTGISEGLANRVGAGLPCVIAPHQQRTGEEAARTDLINRPYRCADAQRVTVQALPEGLPLARLVRQVQDRRIFGLTVNLGQVHAINLPQHRLSLTGGSWPGSPTSTICG